MLISDLEFYLVEIGCVGQEPPVRSVLVRLATDTGEEGWGEAQMSWQSGELAGRRNALLPILAGRSVYDIEDLHGLTPSHRRPSARRWKWPRGTSSAVRPANRFATSLAGGTVGEFP